jgi:hypothetical protein
LPPVFVVQAAFQTGIPNGCHRQPAQKSTLPENPLANDDADLAVRRKLDQELDAELEQMFPASDPLSLTRGPRSRRRVV